MKKKGLIISTVVMVVVLIASLTTATYAWFNQTAQATVDNLAITTEAATGLQIAMTNAEGNTNDLYSGDLEYANGTWNGTTGWGTYLGFSQITVGQISDAATYFAAGETIYVFKGYTAATDTFNSATDYYTKSPVSVTTGDPVDSYYVLAGNTYVQASGTAVDNANYFSIAKVDSPVQEQLTNYLVIDTEQRELQPGEEGYYQPTGYNSKTEPTGYKKVVANESGTYYYLTMAVTNLVEVGAMGFSLEVVPSGDSNLATPTVTATNPGMAAASRVQVKVMTQAPQDTAQVVGTTTLSPFSNWKLNPTTKTMTNSGAGAGDGNANSNGCYVYSLGNGNIPVGTVYYVTMTIWVEGKDAECHDVTTGTAMQFKINFGYSATGSTSIAFSFDNIATASDATTITF